MDQLKWIIIKSRFFNGKSFRKMSDRDVLDMDLEDEENEEKLLNETNDTNDTKDIEGLIFVMGVFNVI